MQQYDVLWQVGTDHAGIATQLVVERKLEGEGKTRESLGQEILLFYLHLQVFFRQPIVLRCLHGPFRLAIGRHTAAFFLTAS